MKQVTVQYSTNARTSVVVITNSVWRHCVKSVYKQKWKKRESKNVEKWMVSIDIATDSTAKCTWLGVQYWIYSDKHYWFMDQTDRWMIQNWYSFPRHWISNWQSQLIAEIFHDSQIWTLSYELNHIDRDICRASSGFWTMNESILCVSTK